MQSLLLDIEALIFGVGPLLLIALPWSPRFPHHLLVAAGLALAGYFLSALAFQSGDPSGLQYMFLLFSLPLYSIAISQVRQIRLHLPYAAVPLCAGVLAAAVQLTPLAPYLSSFAGTLGTTYDQLGLFLIRTLTAIFVLPCLVIYVLLLRKSRAQPSPLSAA